MIAGLLEKAATVSGCALSLLGPAVMPVRPTVWRGASSFSVTALGVSNVGRSFTCKMLTVKVRVTVLLELCPSLTTTVMVTGPLAAVLASASAVNVNVPAVFGLVYCTLGVGMMAVLLEVAATVSG